MPKRNKRFAKFGTFLFPSKSSKLMLRRPAKITFCLRFPVLREKIQSNILVLCDHQYGRR